MQTMARFHTNDKSPLKRIYQNYKNKMTKNNTIKSSKAGPPSTYQTKIKKKKIIIKTIQKNAYPWTYLNVSVHHALD